MNDPSVEYVGIDEDEGSSTKQKTDKVRIFWEGHKIMQNLVAFLEYLNFNIKTIWRYFVLCLF